VKVLITGGPVFEYLDSVKIVTNRFKGGRIAELADHIEDLGATVTYLCSKDSVKPEYISGGVVYHNGYEDYRNQLLKLAPDYDAVILGAAVANLIPDTPWKKTKFPSHDYNEGDRLSIDFVIAPRIINMIKGVAPKTTLIGFKLLNGVDHAELVDAAYGTLVDSRATCVVANDASNLDQKYIITKEKSVIPVKEQDLATFIMRTIRDKYFSTTIMDETFPTSYVNEALSVFKWARISYGASLSGGKDETRGIMFGSIAVRHDDGFVISSRGKKDFAQKTYVSHVDHINDIVYVKGDKASLNAPLIDKIFRSNHEIKSIVHYHKQYDSLPTLDYAFPGTTADSCRKIPDRSFCIKHHGVFLLINKDGSEL